MASSLVPSARADESANSPQQEAAKSTGYDQGDAAKQFPPGEPGKDYAPVITPNGSTLPYKIVEGVKVVHLIPGEVDHEFAPGLRAHCWGFNGQVHGPTIEAVEGDRLRIYVTNRLPENTSIHWHGLLVPSGMDGVAGLSQKNMKNIEHPVDRFGSFKLPQADLAIHAATDRCIDPKRIRASLVTTPLQLRP